MSKAVIEDHCVNIVAWCAEGGSDPPWEIANIIAEFLLFFCHVRRSDNLDMLIGWAG